MSTPVRHVLEVLADGSPAGGSTAVLGLARDLMAMGGWRVSLITAPDSFAARGAADMGVTVRPFDFFTSRFDFRIPGRLAPVVAELAPDIVHAHGGRSAHAFCAGRLAASGTPLVYTVHGYHYLKKRLPLRLAGREAERRIARRVDHVVFVSGHDRRIAVDAGFIDAAGDRASVIPNGIDPADFAGLRPLDRRYDLVFLGRLHPQKNPLFMIDVMAALKGSGTSLLMIGGGELEAAARDRAHVLGVSGDIAFTGTLPRGEALRGLLSASVYVLPSLWEGLPIGPMEALFCRLPVVASRIPGTDEVVTDGEDGVLVEGFDAARYADVIRRLLADAPQRARFGEHGRRRVEAEFLRSRNSERHAALYRCLLGDRPG